MAAGASAAAAAAAIANAIKASGAIVQVEPQDFVALLARAANPLVVMAPGAWGIFGAKLNYLTSYKGLFFFTKCDEALPLPPGTELINAGKIWIPG